MIVVLAVKCFNLNFALRGKRDEVKPMYPERKLLSTTRPAKRWDKERPRYPNDLSYSSSDKRVFNPPTLQGGPTTNDVKVSYR